MSNIISLSITPNGIFGEPFVISAIIYKNKEEISSVSFRCPPVEKEFHPKIKEEIGTTLSNIKETYSSQEAMYSAFAKWYKEVKSNYKILINGSEALYGRFFHTLHQKKLITKDEIHLDIITLFIVLELNGILGLNSDEYAIQKGIIKAEDVNNELNPMFNAKTNALIYFDLIE